MDEIRRLVWEARLAAAHRGAPIAWLTGVRRAGKTTLVRALPDVIPSAGAKVISSAEAKTVRLPDRPDAEVFDADEAVPGPSTVEEASP